jgi:oxygen-independent coproporphyrinogen-3 oxidase
MIGIYVHIPFCVARCRYCDFVSAVYNDGDGRRFLAALEREMETAAPLAAGERANTVYFGGGTPLALGAENLTALLATLKGLFDVTEDAEVTLETNPEAIAGNAAAVLVDAGFNRLSLGAQTFRDESLALLGRRHTAAETEAALARARAAGFENISLDLMYALPETDLAGWREDVKRAAALNPQHLSAYALTLEPEVPLARARDCYAWPGDDEQAAMYYAATDLLAAAGYGHYEISNFARPGRECHHNLKYWRDEDWLAFGPGAAAHWRGGRYRNPADPGAYAAAASVGQWPLAPAEVSDAYREMRTAVTLGLRLTAGINAGEIENRFGVNPLRYYREELAELTAAGLLEVIGENIRLSRRGLFLSDEVMVRLI